MNLLQHDASTLTVDQWNLLSYLSNCYDDQGGLKLGEQFMNEQLKLPIKARYKCTAMMNYFIASMKVCQSLYENNKDFLLVSTEDRFILLTTTIQHTASLSANFIYYLIGLLDNPAFYHTIELIAHPNVVPAAKRLSDRLRMDIIAMKLLLVIISFSTINYTTYSNTCQKNLSNIKQVLDIQNTYIELTWRYLSYKSGYKQAITYISDFVRCLFAVTNSLNRTDDVQFFKDTIGSIVEQTAFCALNTNENSIFLRTIE